MLAAIMATPDLIGAGNPIPTGPCHLKARVSSATTSATGWGSAFSGVLIRTRSANNSPVSVSTGAPLMPDPPTSMPRICMKDLQKIAACGVNNLTSLWEGEFQNASYVNAAALYIVGMYHKNNGMVIKNFIQAYELLERIARESCCAHV